MSLSRKVQNTSIVVVAIGLLVFGGRAILGRIVSQAGQVEVSAAEAVPVTGMRYTEFWEALEDLEVAAAGDLATSADERAFLDAVTSALKADLAVARERLARLRAATDDERIRETAGRMLGQIMVFVGDWEGLLTLAAAEPDLASGGVLEEADLVLARALRGRPAEELSFPDRPVRVRTDRILSGSPRIDVVVNGCRRRFVLDTGASLSVIGDHVARSCGVKPLGDTGYAVTSVSEPVAFRPGIVDDLQLGGLKVKHHPVVILDDDDLEFGLAGVPLIKIDGIIGWSLFRNAAFDIDYSGGWTTITRAGILDAGERNFFWLGYPLVILRDAAGRRLNFGLDTGAAGTHIRVRALTKIDAGPAETRRAVTLGAGGREADATTRA